MGGKKDTIAAVKSQADIVSYIQGTGVALTPAGVGRWKGLCQFHSDHTPSMMVDQNFQNYKCWACGASGDVISYVMNTEMLSFGETLKKLGDQYGVQVDLQEEQGTVDYTSLRKLLQTSTSFYEENFRTLPDGHSAKEEVRKRGLPLEPPTGEQGIVYGYSPDGNRLYKHLQQAGYSDELILLSGLCRRSEKGSIYDFFRSRLMFTFTDRTGHPIGYSSRKLFEDDTRGKYVNSSDSPLFHKARVFYNHALARQTAGKREQLFICEGQFDVNAFVASGMAEAVASSGTAFTQEHMEEAVRMVGEKGKLIFCFDGDEAGVKAAHRVFFTFPLIHEKAYAVFLPDGMDPCDYRLQRGEEEFRRIMGEAKPLVEFIITEKAKERDLSQVLENNKYVQECASIIKAIPSVTLRDSVRRLLSLQAMVSLPEIDRAVAAATPYHYSEAPKREHQEVPQEIEGGEERRGSEERAALISASLQEDLYYDAAARFVSLGLERPAWRASVLRSKEALPKPFQPFVQELAKLPATQKHLFPELFEEEAVARLLLTDSYATFYKFLTPEELKEHFIYLHGRVTSLALEQGERRTVKSVLKLLRDDEKNQVAYFAKLLAKEEQRRAKLSLGEGRK